MDWGVSSMFGHAASFLSDIACNENCPLSSLLVPLKGLPRIPRWPLERLATNVFRSRLSHRSWSNTCLFLKGRVCFLDECSLKGTMAPCSTEYME